MTIQGAIAELNLLIADNDVPFYFKPNIEKIKETIISEFAVPGRKKGEWIPVSERLPEESQNYLVIIREKFNKEHWWIDICDIDTDGFVKTWNVREPYYVEAWQPLPEPYKAESEE